MPKFYHKTDVSNVTSILEHGLLVNKSTFSTPRIYLCTHPEMDMGLGKALFEVTIPDDDPELNFSGEGWQLMSFKDIPPEWIRYLGEYGRNEAPDNV